MYRYAAAGSPERKPKVRDGECVALVQVYASVPRTIIWRAGERVVESKALLAGTAIATLVKGSYPDATKRRHAAFFLRYGPRDVNGIAASFWVIEQYNHPPIQRIQARLLHIKGGAPGPDGTWPDANNNANAFYVIE